MEFKIHKYVDYQNDKRLMSEIKELIAKSYKVAGAHIEHDIEVCNEIYTIGPENGKIIAFFMVGYHIIHNLQCCYLGLSVCNREYRDYGLSTRLYLRFMKDCVEKEKMLSQRIICYCTTATPIIWHVVHKLWIDVQPDIDGNCTDEAKKILLTIVQNKYSGSEFDPKVPFLLRHAAKEINYSNQAVSGTASFKNP